MIQARFSDAQQSGRTIIIDGGLATLLEEKGHNLNDALWSARLLIEQPDVIVEAHRDYLEAGAEIIATASYQATIEGLMARGMSEARARELLVLSAELAIQTRDQFIAEHAPPIRPLVAASIGPYGAYLANGAEYTGDYDLDVAGLADFHRDRWHLLAATGVDLLACETIPSLPETHALLTVLRETPNCAAWISYSCKDDTHISDGTPIVEVANLVDNESQIAAIGINCTHPDYVPELLRKLRAVTNKPLLVYPNSGEAYDPVVKEWVEGSAESPAAYCARAAVWRDLGATLIGGCCRTSPEHIALMRAEITA